MITVTAFKWVPPTARGLVKDLRVRWALEEAGLPYKTRLLDQGDQKSAEYRAKQPFGQVPVLEENGVTLFESGSIALYLGERSESLLPKDPAARARAVTWVFAALNTLEPMIGGLADVLVFSAGEEWAKLRRPVAEERVVMRLGELAAALGDKEYLDGRFTVGDLIMTTVLRQLHATPLVRNEPRLAAYQARCEARPAFGRALAAHMADFEER
jgi:glutathione S-transferase